MLAVMRYLIEISACEGKRGKAGLDRGRSGLWYMPGNALANLKRALEQDLLFRGSIIEPSLSACCLRKGMTMGQTALWSRSSAWWAGSWSWMEMADCSHHSLPTGISEKGDLRDASLYLPHRSVFGKSAKAQGESWGYELAQSRDSENTEIRKQGPKNITKRPDSMS